MHALYQDHVLNNSEVCSSCFRRVRRPRPQPGLGRADAHRQLAPSTRVKRTTSIEHVPGDPPADDHGTFCACGVESAFAFERPLREPRDDVLDRAKRLSRTLDALQVDHDRVTFFQAILEEHGPWGLWPETDELLARALHRANVASQVADDSRDAGTRPPKRDRAGSASAD